ncbi:hypothetical protein F66182_14396, partial [Fusarium sp. NRRL 66182]
MDVLTDILHQSDESFNDLCFDISRFNAPAFQVSDFIGSLIHQDNIEQQQMLKYERTLKYVEFPSLDMMAESREGFKESTYLKTTHREVFQILEWLNVKKGVQKIIKLVVPDRLVNPHDELEMAWYVNQFQVEVLDWKTLDLSISAFQNPLPPKRLKQTEIETSATAAIRIKPTLGKTLGKSEKKKPTEHLRELSLYSSGRRAAVY